jgi:hypothetical protein
LSEIGAVIISTLRIGVIAKLSTTADQTTEAASQKPARSGNRSVRVSIH